MENGKRTEEEDWRRGMEVLVQEGCGTGVTAAPTGMQEALVGCRGDS